MASSKKWQTAKYKQAVSKAEIKNCAWVYSKRKIAAEDAAFFTELFKTQKAESVKTASMREWI